MRAATALWLVPAISASGPAGLGAALSAWAGTALVSDIDESLLVGVIWFTTAGAEVSTTSDGGMPPETLELVPEFTDAGALTFAARGEAVAILGAAGTELF